MADYWITLRRNKAERLGFSTKTATSTIAAVERMRNEGWDEIRIIGPDGEEISEEAVRSGLDGGKIDTNELPRLIGMNCSES